MNSIVPYDPTNPLVKPFGDNGSFVSTGPITYTRQERQTALNGKLVCEPFKSNTVKKKERSGFATVDQKVTLVPLTVFVGTEKIPTGSTIFVRAEACAMGWGKETFESEGMPPFILVPEGEVIFAKVIDVVPNYNGYTWTLQNESTIPGTVYCNANAEK